MLYAFHLLTIRSTPAPSPTSFSPFSAIWRIPCTACAARTCNFIVYFVCAAHNCPFIILLNAGKAETKTNRYKTVGRAWMHHWCYRRPHMTFAMRPSIGMFIFIFTFPVATVTFVAEAETVARWCIAVCRQWHILFNHTHPVQFPPECIRSWMENQKSRWIGEILVSNFCFVVVAAGHLRLCIGDHSRAKWINYSVVRTATDAE